MSSVSAEPGHAAVAPCPVGTVTVSVAASSANLGPGFDTLGLALGLRDRVTAIATRPALDSAAGTDCRVEGQGAGTVPTGDDHLVAATIRAALTELLPGVGQPAIVLHCVNGIPHGRGLGSSAAAIVAGLGIAWELAAGVTPLDPAQRLPWLVDRSSTIEGHGDNASAAVLGGAVVAWSEAGHYRATGLAVDPGLRLVIAVPQSTLPTHLARSILTDSVPRADAVFTGARTVVLSLALAGRADLLMPATEDRLHQDAREVAMPVTLELVRDLRRHGIAAVVSGAGPSVLAFDTTAAAVAQRAGGGWQVSEQSLGHGIDVVDVALGTSATE